MFFKIYISDLSFMLHSKLLSNFFIYYINKYKFVAFFVLTTVESVSKCPVARQRASEEKNKR